MALTDESGSGFNVSMPVAPAYGGGFGGFGSGDWSWIIILLLFGMFGGGYGFGGGFDGGIYPWLNNSQNISGGFRDQMIGTQINGIQNAVTSGFGDVQTALCGGFAGVNASINGAKNALAQQMYGNEINSLERSFAAQSAVTGGLSNIQSQLAQCCCDNRLATVQTQNVVATEGAATRLAIQEQTQQILDKLCEQEIETLRQANVSLQNQVNMLNLAASQTAQSAYLVDKLTPTTAATAG